MPCVHLMRVGGCVSVCMLRTPAALVRFTLDARVIATLLMSVWMSMFVPAPRLPQPGLLSFAVVRWPCPRWWTEVQCSGARHDLHRHRSAEYVVEQWRSDEAYDPALSRVEWAMNRDACLLLSTFSTSSHVVPRGSLPFLPSSPCLASFSSFVRWGSPLRRSSASPVHPCVGKADCESPRW